MSKSCENCTSTSINGERFCKGCRTALLSEMKKTNYLTKAPIYFGDTRRTAEKMEDTYVTKHGTGY